LETGRLRERMFERKAEWMEKGLKNDELTERLPDWKTDTLKG
jgi:hypothetical protein